MERLSLDGSFAIVRSALCLNAIDCIVALPVTKDLIRVNVAERKHDVV